MEKEVNLPAKDLEEQRRLLYVGITRAKTAVIFSWAWSRKTGKRFKAGGGGFISRERSPLPTECGLIHDADKDKVLYVLRELAEHEQNAIASN